jgi:hypothetical protein
MSRNEGWAERKDVQKIRIRRGKGCAERESEQIGWMSRDK